MPRLAIVISAAGSVDALEATLVSVLENRPAGCEVLVALTRPYADPYDLKDEVRFLTPPRRTSPVAALNLALASVQSPVVHVLAAGCVVSEGWTNAALSHFADRASRRGGPLGLERRRADEASGGGHRLPSKRTASPGWPGRQGRRISNAGDGDWPRRVRRVLSPDRARIPRRLQLQADPPASGCRFGPGDQARGISHRRRARFKRCGTGGSRRPAWLAFRSAGRRTAVLAKPGESVTRCADFPRSGRDLGLCASCRGQLPWLDCSARPGRTSSSAAMLGTV